MYLIEGILIWGIIIIIAFGIPGVLTIWNLYNLCGKKQKYTNRIALTTLIVGFLDYLFLFAIQLETAGEWYEQVNYMQVHNSISGAYEISFTVPILVGMCGLLILLFASPERLSPALSALAVASVVLLNVFQIAYSIQISKQIFHDLYKLEVVINVLFYVYHFNILVISAIALKKQMKYQLDFYRALPETATKGGLTGYLYKTINNIYRYSGLVVLCFILLVAVLEIIFILIGQGADGPIKAFTDTADWTFSKQIPPPPAEYDGHYLCTVAAGGHKNVVKPLRFGKRRGQIIVVNRQLCVANAFEDYIQEKLPKFHRIIRGMYDRYGYPISKHITTPGRADVVYLVMKPLEWIFVVFLYLFDVKPEERIRRQYRL